jgi:hypothetical protein
VISGRSNGGLLMGAMLTQRPDLFRAVICGVPLLDMVRYHRFGAGMTWVDEYGSAETEAGFRTLHAYSPYHRVRPGTVYPTVLFLSADTDDRVDPLHARKMAAALQAATKGGPVLLRIERNAGHGGADKLSQEIDEDADVFAFLMNAVGLTLRPLYALRGLLFLLRAEATGVDPGTKGLTPADIGLFATRLTRPKNDLTRGPGLKQVVAAAWDAAPDAATARTLKATFRRLAEEPRMKAGSEVKAAALDEAARDRVSSLAALVRDAADELEAARAAAPPPARRSPPWPRSSPRAPRRHPCARPQVSPGSTRPPARWSPVCVRCWTTPPPPTTCAPPSSRSSPPSRPS